ncbi:PulJ/GspJ family protein [Amnibacterium setariae]|uniref:PulJ/GspJ family protein n=1 Tax=Amnibacterium setariae TaxID=2306585 RepID=UPI0011C48BE4|nr:prepilin-type N-terminal cleavage/methylation domain-containing protein [Amnibacterium setariae]
MKSMKLTDATGESGGRDSGFTIIELLVTMVVTGIVLAMMGTFFANISRLTNWSGNDRNATGQAAIAMDAIRATIRTAAKTSDTPAGAAIQYGSATRVSLIAYSDVTNPGSNPVLVTYCLQDGVLSENRQLGSSQDPSTKVWSFPSRSLAYTGDCSKTSDWQVVATGFSTTGASPFFAYLNTASRPIAMSGQPPQLADADRRDNVTFVQVVATLDSTTTSGSGRPVIVSSAIGMPGVKRDVDPTATVPNLPTPTETPTPTPTIPRATATSAPSTPTSSSPSPTTSGGGSGTGTGTGSGSGTGPGTSSPGAGSGGTGGTAGGGSGTSTPAPTKSTPKPTATTTTTPTPTKTPTQKPTPPQVIDY